jgi:hypothetical protein
MQFGTSVRLRVLTAACAAPSDFGQTGPVQLAANLPSTPTTTQKAPAELNITPMALLASG